MMHSQDTMQVPTIIANNLDIFEILVLTGFMLIVPLHKQLLDEVLVICIIM